MGRRLAALLLVFSTLMLLTSSSPSISFTTVVQERNQIENGLLQNIRTGHGGGDGGSGYGGGQGGGNGDSSSTTQPGRPLNGAGSDNQNHHRRGVAIRSSTSNFSILTVSFTLSLALYRFL